MEHTTGETGRIIVYTRLGLQTERSERWVAADSRMKLKCSPLRHVKASSPRALKWRVIIL